MESRSVLMSLLSRPGATVSSPARASATKAVEMSPFGNKQEVTLLIVDVVISFKDAFTASVKLVKGPPGENKRDPGRLLGGTLINLRTRDPPVSYTHLTLPTKA